MWPIENTNQKLLEYPKLKYQTNRQEDQKNVLSLSCLSSNLGLWNKVPQLKQ